MLTGNPLIDSVTTLIPSWMNQHNQATNPVLQAVQTNPAGPEQEQNKVSFFQTIGHDIHVDYEDVLSWLGSHSAAIGKFFDEAIAGATGLLAIAQAEKVPTSDTGAISNVIVGLTAAQTTATALESAGSLQQVVTDVTGLASTLVPLVGVKSPKTTAGVATVLSKIDDAATAVQNAIPSLVQAGV